MIAAAPVVGSFTPAHALLGGATLGIAVFAKLHITGRVTGISGIAGGLVNGADGAPWRLAFVGGLVAAGLLLRMAGAGDVVFEPLPGALSLLHFAGAGFLVGMGSSLGNGCTSGHGICGLARLSKRSLAHVATFMAVGAATAVLSGVGEVFQRAPAHGVLAPLLLPDALVLAQAGGLVVTAAVTMSSIYFVARGAADAPAEGKQRPVAHTALELAAEATAGLFFGLGLGLSGMTLPSKVVGFLSITLPAWDPSLACVMGGGLAIAGAGFHYAGKPAFAAPACAARFTVPTSTAIDHRLLGGAALFGAGWGLGGMCPGPMIVSLASGEAGVWAAFAGMLAGWYAHGLLARAAPKVF